MLCSLIQNLLQINRKLFLKLFWSLVLVRRQLLERAPMPGHEGGLMVLRPEPDTADFVSSTSCLSSAFAWPGSWL